MSRILRRRRSRPCWPRWHRVGRWTQAEIDAVRERAHRFDAVFAVQT